MYRNVAYIAFKKAKTRKESYGVIFRTNSSLEARRFVPARTCVRVCVYVFLPLLARKTFAHFDKLSATKLFDMRHYMYSFYRVHKLKSRAELFVVRY